MTSLPHSTQWPKPHLLKCLEAAVKQGCIRLDFRSLYGPDAEAKAKSFFASLNRIRRRIDKQHASFILPEYHLVGFTWEAERGTVLLTYSSLPDNLRLPEIESLSEEEKQELYHPTVRVLPFPPEPSPTQASERPPLDTDALIDQLLAQESTRLP